jgi:uncharacterized lipoprotein YmbA
MRPLRAVSKALLTLGALLVVSQTACFGLARNAPPLRQYTLTGPTGGGPDTRSGLAVGVRRLDLASYLAVPFIVVRRGEHEITTTEFQRWGERLDEAINRVVAAHLAAWPAVRTVEVAPWSARVRHDVVVQLHVSRFEGVALPGAGGGHVAMQIGWDLIRPLDGRVLVRGTSEERSTRWRVGDYAQLVQGLDSSLLRVAGDIGRCLAGFRNDSTPPAVCGAAAAGGAR